MIYTSYYAFVKLKIWSHEAILNCCFVRLIHLNPFRHLQNLLFERSYSVEYVVFDGLLSIWGAFARRP